MIGGGISGLACAYRLQRAGISVRILDAASRPGGAAIAVRVDHTSEREVAAQLAKRVGSRQRNGATFRH